MRYEGELPIYQSKQWRRMQSQSMINAMAVAGVRSQSGNSNLGYDGVCNGIYNFNKHILNKY